MVEYQSLPLTGVYIKDEPLIKVPAKRVVVVARYCAPSEEDLVVRLRHKAAQKLKGNDTLENAVDAVMAKLPEPALKELRDTDKYTALVSEMCSAPQKSKMENYGQKIIYLKVSPLLDQKVALLYEEEATAGKVIDILPDDDLEPTRLGRAWLKNGPISNKRLDVLLKCGVRNSDYLDVSTTNLAYTDVEEAIRRATDDSFTQKSRFMDLEDVSEMVADQDLISLMPYLTEAVKYDKFVLKRSRTPMGMMYYIEGKKRRVEVVESRPTPQPNPFAHLMGGDIETTPPSEKPN